MKSFPFILPLGFSELWSLGINPFTMEDMVGKWKLEKRDPNFEDFLICRQVNIGTLRDHLTLDSWLQRLGGFSGSWWPAPLWTQNTSSMRTKLHSLRFTWWLIVSVGLHLKICCLMAVSGLVLTTFFNRWPRIFRGQQNIQCPHKESSSQRKAFRAKKKYAYLQMLWITIINLKRWEDWWKPVEVVWYKKWGAALTKFTQE